MKFSRIKRASRKVVSKLRNSLKRTRYRLTLLYSSMVMLFLILFVVVVYSVVASFIHNEQKHQIINSASKEWTIHHEQVILQKLLIILVGLALVFLIIAFIVTQFTARRSVLPIVRMYNKQRQFVSDASHELRTPLSVIYSTIEVLELEEKDTMSEFGYGLLLDMKSEVKSMNKLVKELLTLAQSDVGAAEIRYEKFDLSSEIKQVLRLFGPLADLKHITINIDAPDSLVTYKDREKIRQLVYILLDNAVKYTKEGGKVQLTLFKEDSDERICIQIQDTGIGIKQEQLKRIFDRFYRGDKSRTKEFGGSGLGLAIAKTIVNAHKGNIEVSSVYGEGTTFTVYLPA